MDLYDVRSAAAYLNLRESTIRKWILTRKLGSTRLGRSVRIPKHELDKLIRQGFRPSVDLKDGAL